jgi:serine/threonine-protein kinase HipA
MAHELNVWLFVDRVGTLALVQGRLNFCYAPGWLVSATRAVKVLT